MMKAFAYIFLMMAIFALAAIISGATWHWVTFGMCLLMFIVIISQEQKEKNNGL